MSKKHKKSPKIPDDKHETTKGVGQSFYTLLCWDLSTRFPPKKYRRNGVFPSDSTGKLTLLSDLRKSQTKWKVTHIFYYNYNTVKETME